MVLTGRRGNFSGLAYLANYGPIAPEPFSARWVRRLKPLSTRCGAIIRCNRYPLIPLTGVSTSSFAALPLLCRLRWRLHLLTRTHHGLCAPVPALVTPCTPCTLVINPLLILFSSSSPLPSAAGSSFSLLYTLFFLDPDFS